MCMLCAQFYARTMQPSHPSHAVVTRPSGPRDIKLTLAKRFHPFVQQCLVNGILPEDRYKSTIKDIHSVVVGFTIDSYDTNPVLRTIPPEVNKSEQKLCRPIRATLCQLRSGWCKDLHSYKYRIGLSDSPSCPSCHSADQTVEHLFECAAFPTNLCVLDLWLRPLTMARFLKTLPTFSALPAVDPPAQPPPPEPPP